MQDVLALLSAKIGVVALLLGALHLVNVAALGAIRRRSSSRRRELAAPVPPPVAYYPPFPAPHGYAGPVPR